MNANFCGPVYKMLTESFLSLLCFSLLQPEHVYAKCSLVSLATLATYLDSCVQRFVEMYKAVSKLAWFDLQCAKCL